MPQPRPTQLEGVTDLTVFADIKPGLIDGIFDSRSYVWAAAAGARTARRGASRQPRSRGASQSVH